MNQLTKQYRYFRNGLWMLWEWLPHRQHQPQQFAHQPLNRLCSKLKDGRQRHHPNRYCYRQTRHHQSQGKKQDRAN
jgi:hypothetical protein